MIRAEPLYCAKLMLFIVISHCYQMPRYRAEQKHCRRKVCVHVCVYAVYVCVGFVLTQHELLGMHSSV